MMRETVIPALAEFDAQFRENGASVLAGVDEAGRGPLAGGVFAAAVVLPPSLEIPYLNDSKKLTERRRELLFDVICQSAVAFGIAETSVEEIERLNILNAAMLAMNRAVSSMAMPDGSPVRPNLVLIDGDKARGFAIETRCVVGGDALSQSIAAASVLAKVSRDRSMRALAALYPEYGFDKHKGYGTKAHYQALDRFGPSPVHRLSFLKKYFAAKRAEE